MLNIEPTQIYPCFFACKNEAEFQSLDTQACELLDFPNAGATDYCSPIIDFEGKFYFTINPEISKLFTEKQLENCVPYDKIVLPEPKKL
jgi:hypothetical protein